MFPESQMSCESTLGSSPPCRPCIAEGSDLFKAVMEDFASDEDSLLSRAVVDRAMSKSTADSAVAGKTVAVDMSHLCKRCLRDRALCQCFTRRGKVDSHRVQWIDEMYDKPLAMEQTVEDIDSGRGSPGCGEGKKHGVKPILKHKANCIIIVSE